MTTTPTETLAEYPLELIQGKTYYRRFAWRRPDASYANFHDWVLRSQVRTKEDPIDGELILDLTSMLTVVDDTSTGAVAGNGKFLELRIPGRVTAALPSVSQLRKGTAFWDVFAVSSTDTSDDERLFQGPASMDYAATDMRSAEA